MTCTSEVATAPVSPGAASRPTRPPGPVARGWRVLRTGAAFVTFGLGAIVVAALVAPLRLLGRATPARREVRTQRVVHHAFRLFAWWMARLGLVRVSWIDAQRLRGPGPWLFVANHPTLIDVVLLLARLPQADCIVKTAARRNPFMRSIVTGAGYIANDHGDALVDACAGRIAEGRAVVLFPEGTRSPRGGLGRFQRGAAHIALKSGCPIVPIVITCRPPTLLKGQPWHDVPARRARYVLRVDEPIDPARYLNAETTLPVAARRLTADLQALFERRLGADEDHP
jgi:1-acyl-sn-glycerol-3-phosphate acyltransferase